VKAEQWVTSKLLKILLAVEALGCPRQKRLAEAAKIR